jgi:hypothetical protein
MRQSWNVSIPPQKSDTSIGTKLLSRIRHQYLPDGEPVSRINHTTTAETGGLPRLKAGICEEIFPACCRLVSPSILLL